MKVLIIGSGAREHAIAWKLLQDDPELQVIAAPGNAGLAAIARCVPIATMDIAQLLALALREKPDFTIVGPEGPLEAGIVDSFRARGLPIFGPTRAAARIETSKGFAKRLMKDARIPTARASHHTTAETAIRAAHAFGAPVVIKASGLAGGKGVIVAETMAEAERAIVEMLEKRTLGNAGSELLIEEFMEGEELSIFAVCDGQRSRVMLAAQDHKRLEEADRGPNTGGMGAYAPVSLDSPALRSRVAIEIVNPTLYALSNARCPFTGVLYVGVMLTRSGPRVVEFNCRFGDPETQTLLPLMLSSLLEPLRTVARGDSLTDTPEFEWRPEASVTTVLAASGYPLRARTGDVITFPPGRDDVHLFHAGTRIAGASAGNAKHDGEQPTIVTDGGRVLSVTAVAPTLRAAAETSRAYAEAVQFAGKQMRRDIGWRDLRRAATRRR